jgi:RNA polymerase sigma factor (sigma-70 family)
LFQALLRWLLANKEKESLPPKRVGPEKLQLIDRYLMQAQEIRERIVSANLRLALKNGLRYLPGQQEECISIGAEAIDKAAATFDYSMGIKFSTYATPAINWAFLKHRKEQLALKDSGCNHAYSIEELNLAAKLDSGPDTTHHARVAEKMEIITRYFSKLKPNEQKVLCLSFGIETPTPLTFKEIGEEIKLSKQRAQQIQKEALARLQTLISESDLDEL